RDLLLDFCGLHALGHVGRYRDHPAAVYAIDVAHARRRHALYEVADRHVPRLRLHAQIVDLVEAATIGRKAHENVHRFVAVDRPVFGRFQSIGDKLDGAANRVYAGAVFCGLGFVDFDLPIDARQRQAIVEVADIAARSKHGGNLARSRRQLRGIQRRELHLNGLARGPARARRRHFDKDAWDIDGLGADGVHDLVRRRPAAPVRELELDHADGVFGEFAHAARLLADAGVHGLEAIEGENALLDGADQ